eukprot:2229020-Pleurochrysis_carterae.AAC.3
MRGVCMRVSRSIVANAIAVRPSRPSLLEPSLSRARSTNACSGTLCGASDLTKHDTCAVMCGALLNTRQREAEEAARQADGVRRATEKRLQERERRLREKEQRLRPVQVRSQRLSRRPTRPSPTPVPCVLARRGCLVCVVMGR